MTNHITSSVRPAPPVGGFQQIGDRRLFVHRAGSGGPAVVFLPGASAVGLDYLGVQQGVSRFTTAVVYDRGGTGYSDPLALPRTATAVATELHELLGSLDVPAPYVLVPHSLGGFYAHRFAQLYPREVAGLVWLDAFNRDWDTFLPPAMHLSALERAAPGPEQLEQSRPAVRDMRGELLAGYPAHVREPLIDAHESDAWMRVGIAERSGLAGLAAELRAGPGLPDVPAVALTVLGVDPAQRAQMPQDTVREMLDGRTRMDAALMDSVSYGEQRLLPDTLHHRLCFDRPDAVVRAVRDVLDRVARGENYMITCHDDPRRTVLTISQLAATAGVTVRTVRHYHQVGLLPEPERDASGYRRYSAQAAVDLIRIRTLADAGVPLARIDALLHAEPEEFASAIDDIDAGLQRKIDRLSENRRRIAELAGGERLVLPPEVVAVLERMRGLGVGELRIRLERDAWILMRAMDPQAVARRVREKNAELDDPETTRLFLACDRSADWDPYDPRLDRLIDDLDAWEVAHGRDDSRGTYLKLVSSRISEASPAWQRIIGAVAHRAEQRRTARLDT
ncbi:alpha/beta fold hydrolase [Streptomyces sp. NBC_01104]|uniref:alpha/beta fold hydrolase n=1 Tax=Streptomyces sp. NBC_01104 TaxID=2903750 RepID=UPI00386E0BD5|nr:alpha/beta fold hydrolase [Streptomyces sp. NBC_01104]